MFPEFSKMKRETAATIPAWSGQDMSRIAVGDWEEAEAIDRIGWVETRDDEKGGVGETPPFLRRGRMPERLFWERKVLEGGLEPPRVAPQDP